MFAFDKGRYTAPRQDLLDEEKGWFVFVGPSHPLCLGPDNPRVYSWCEWVSQDEDGQPSYFVVTGWNPPGALWLYSSGGRREEFGTFVTEMISLR